VKADKTLFLVALAIAACGGTDQPTVPCGGADVRSLQTTLDGLSPACRVDLGVTGRCTSPEFMECNGFCRGNEVIFCGRPAGECSGSFLNPAIDGLLERASSARIEHPFADGRGFTSFEMDTEAEAMSLETMVRGLGCETECKTDEVVRRGRVVVSWPKWTDTTDPVPPCFAEVRALLGAR
jgi:hypothetical protein